RRPYRVARRADRATRDQTIEATAMACTTLAEPLGRLQAIPGVGQVGPHRADQPAGARDPGSQTDHCVGGLAPLACESGLQRALRAVWGGRGDAWAMLFLAAQSAIALECAAAALLLVVGRTRKLTKAALSGVEQAADRHQRHDAQPPPVARGGRRRT